MKNKKLILLFIIILTISKIIIITTTYGVIEEKNKYDFEHYQKVSKTLIGQETDISKRAWQYPPLYSILIIPTLFFNDVDYLSILQIVIAVVSFYFLFLFCNIFVSEKKAILISFIIIFFNSAYATIKIGMPISISSLLFIVFSYHLYKIRTNLYYCSLSFLLLILTKYLFIALVPFIVYWIMYNYDFHRVKRTILFFIMPIVILCSWFLRNAILYGFNIVGILGGYEHIDINMHLVPDKIIFLFTDVQSIGIMLIYLMFIATYILFFNTLTRRMFNNKYYVFNTILIIYFITTFFMFGFLYQIDGFRIRYFIYQTPVIFTMAFINIVLIDKRLRR